MGRGTMFFMDGVYLQTGINTVREVVETLPRLTMRLLQLRRILNLCTV